MGRNKFDDRIHLRDTESSSIFRSFVFLEHINELLSCDLEYSLSVHSFGICTTAGKKHTIGEKFATWIGSHTITELNAYVRCEFFFLTKHKDSKRISNGIRWIWGRHKHIQTLLALYLCFIQNPYRNLPAWNSIDMHWIFYGRWKRNESSATEKQRKNERTDNGEARI